MSQVGSPQRREASRTWALVSPASRSGVTAPRSAAARMPGRKPGDRVVGVGAGRDVRQAALGGQRGRARRAARPCRRSSGRRRWRGSPRAPSRGSAGVSTAHPERLGELARRVALDLRAASGSSRWRRRPGPGRGRGPRPRAGRRCPRRRCRRPAPSRASRRSASSAASRAVEQVLVEPGRELLEGVEHHVGARPRAAPRGCSRRSAPRRSARRRRARPRRRGRGRRRRSRRPPGAARRPCRRPTPSPRGGRRRAPRWSTWRRALSGYLPVTTTTRPRVAAYGGERLVRPRQHRHRRDGVVGVERPEPVPGGADRVRGQVRGQHRGRAAGPAARSSPRRGTPRRARRRARAGSRRSPARCRSGSCRGRTRPPGVSSWRCRACCQG